MNWKWEYKLSRRDYGCVVHRIGGVLEQGIVDSAKYLARGIHELS